MKDPLIWDKFNPFLKKFKLNKFLIEKDLEEDCNSYIKIKKWFEGKRINKKRLKFYYPGFGGDMLNILAMYDSLVLDNEIAEFVFVDTIDSHADIVGGFKRYLKGVKIKEKKEKGKYIITAYFKNKKFKATCYTADAVEFIPKELINIDVYYERGFELFRSNNKFFMDRLRSLINKKGLMITDSGFDFNSSGEFKRLKGLPKEFGLYENFQIWQRKE